MHPDAHRGARVPAVGGRGGGEDLGGGGAERVGATGLRARLVRWTGRDVQGGRRGDQQVGRLRRRQAQDGSNSQENHRGCDKLPRAARQLHHGRGLRHAQAPGHQSLRLTAVATQGVHRRPFGSGHERSRQQRGVHRVDLGIRPG